MSETNNDNRIFALCDMTEGQRAMRLALGCIGHNKHMVTHSQEAGAHHEIQGEGKFETVTVADVDGNSPLSNAVHRLWVMHKDNGQGHDPMTKISIFWALNGMLCEQFCRNTGINPKHWKKTESARTHRFMELHNELINCQDSQALSDNECKGMTGERCTDPTTTLNRAGLEA